LQNNGYSRRFVPRFCSVEFDDSYDGAGAEGWARGLLLAT